MTRETDITFLREYLGGKGSVVVDGQNRVVITDKSVQPPVVITINPDKDKKLELLVQSVKQTN